MTTMTVIGRCPVRYAVIGCRGLSNGIEERALPLPGRLAVIRLGESQLGIGSVLGIEFDADPAPSESFCDSTGRIRTGKWIEDEVSRCGQELDKKSRQLRREPRRVDLFSAGFCFFDVAAVGFVIPALDQVRRNRTSPVRCESRLDVVTQTRRVDGRELAAETIDRISISRHSVPATRS
jgi:hypothetical protein